MAFFDSVDDMEQAKQDEVGRQARVRAEALIRAQADADQVQAAALEFKDKALRMGIAPSGKGRKAWWRLYVEGCEMAIWLHREPPVTCEGRLLDGEVVLAQVARCSYLNLSSFAPKAIAEMGNMLKRG